MNIIAKALTDHGLSQPELAERADVSVWTIRKYQRANGAFATPEYERVMNVIEELDRKRREDGTSLREYRIAHERYLEELRADPNPALRPIIARIESILYTGFTEDGVTYPALITIEAVEEPQPPKETN